MTNSQPLDDMNIRLDDFGTRLDQLGDDIDLLRTIQDANRRELRFTSQSLARLERIVTQIADTVRLQGSAAEADREQAAADRQQAAIDRQTFQNNLTETNQQFQSEIRRIWEYLSSQNRNGEGTQ